MKFLTPLILGIVLFAGCASQEEFESATQEVRNQDDVIKKLKEENSALRIEYDELNSRYELARLELDRLRDAANLAAEVGDLKSQLENIRKRFGNIDGVDVIQRADGVALSVAGSVLFKTGSDEISDKGKDVLSQIAAEINRTSQMIRVEGHTDNVPVARTLSKYPRGNLELSGERALNVADYLIKQCSVDRARTSFAGFGPERPASDNATDEGRARNRRVEIVILN